MAVSGKNPKKVCIKNSVFPGFSHISNVDKLWDSQPASIGWNPTSWGLFK